MRATYELKRAPNMARMGLLLVKATLFPRRRVP
jgi:hypothetical protein